MDNCSFAGTVNGVDAGTGTVNTAGLIIPNGKALTVQNAQKLAAGSLTVNNGGMIILPKGAVFHIGKPLWISPGMDADGDGVPGSGGDNMEISANQPVGNVRKSTYSAPGSYDCNDTSPFVWVSGIGYTDADGDGYTAGTSPYTCFNNTKVVLATKASIGTAAAVTITPGRIQGAQSPVSDCNDTGTNAANVQISAACYQDADNDDYGNTTADTCIPAGSTCATATWGSQGSGTTAYNLNHASNASDCCDNNASVSPAQTGWFTTAIPAGCTASGTFDWNCSGAVEKLHAENGQCLYKGGVCIQTLGFLSSVACGASGDKIASCIKSGTRCLVTDNSVLQECH